MQSLAINYQPTLEPENSPRKLRVIFHSNLLLSLYTCCEAEDSQPLRSLFTLAYAGEIVPYIEDRQLELVKDYIKEFAPQKAQELIEELEEDFTTYSVTKEDLKQVSKLKLDSFSAGIALVCAKRQNIDVVIFDTVQITSSSYGIPLLKPEEFLLLYDHEQGKLKEIVPHNSSQPPVKTYVSHNNSNEDPESIVKVKFGDWNVENFETTILLNSETKANVMLWNSELGKSIHRNAVGNGPVDALVKAFNLAMKEALPQATFPSPRVDHLSLESAGSGSNSLVLAQVTLSNTNEKSFTESFTHTDTVKAVFCAYLKATSAFFEKDVSKQNPYSNLSAEALVSSYQKCPGQKKVLLLKEVINKHLLPGLNLNDTLIVQSSLNNTVISTYGENEADWYEVQIRSSELIASTFDSAKLSNLEISDSKFVGANFIKAKLINARIISSDFSRIQFDKSELEYCTIYTCQFDSARFNYAYLNNIVFSCTDLRNANFTEAKIRMSFFLRAKLIRANFRKAKINYSNFMRANLAGADFSKAELSKTSFAFANLEGVNFSDCDLSSVNLYGAKLAKANLTGATISESQRKQIKSENIDLSVINIIDSCSGKERV